MGLLNFGRKKKEVVIDNDLAGAPLPMPSLDSSTNPNESNPIPVPSSLDNIPEPSLGNADIPSPDSSDLTLEPEPIQNSETQDDSSASNIDPILNFSSPTNDSSDTISNDLLEPPNELLSEDQSSDALAPLPEFSQDDFSEPQVPVQAKNIPVVENILVQPEPIKSPENDKSSLFSPAPVSSSSSSSPVSSIKNSYAASQGVFVYRTAYISVLSTLAESVKSMASLSTKQKHFIDYDVATKKLLEVEATASESLHKSILAVLPFLSKK